VLSGYGKSPAYIINTNLVGTINCLELVRKNNADVVFLSTSRVYPYNVINNIKTTEADTRFEWAEIQDTKIAGWSKYGIDENFIHRGAKSMYGATKYCSEVLLQECMSMNGMKWVINRCGVIAGPWQFGKADQGVFTHWMLAHYFRKQLKYIGFGGKGKQVRDLLHIDDLFDLLDLQIKNIDNLNEGIYNVGGGEINLSLLETTQMCEGITGNRITIKSEPTTRPADLIIYKSNNQRISSILNWKPKRNAERILNDIYLWIRDNENLLTA
jgi:CDP-paratose 2-epimerase